MEAAAAGQGDKRKRAPTAFVFAPGAGSEAALEMVKLHGKLEAGDAVLRVEAGARVQPRRRCGHVLAAAAAAHATLGRRSCCAARRSAAASSPGDGAGAAGTSDDGALRTCSSAGGSSTDRTGHLARLPAEVRACFVEGDQDPFLGPTGLASLREVAGRMAAAHEIHVVAHGSHTVPQADALKSRSLTQDLVTASVAEAIRSFVDGE